MVTAMEITQQDLLLILVLKHMEIQLEIFTGVLILMATDIVT